MESTKNYFEKMADTQNKLIENWLDTSKKFQESTVNGDVLKKGTEMFTEWQKKQQDILKEKHG